MSRIVCFAEKSILQKISKIPLKKLEIYVIIKLPKSADAVLRGAPTSAAVPHGNLIETQIVFASRKLGASRRRAYGAQICVIIIKDSIAVQPKCAVAAM